MIDWPTDRPTNWVSEWVSECWSQTLHMSDKQKEREGVLLPRSSKFDLYDFPQFHPLTFHYAPALHSRKMLMWNDSTFLSKRAGVNLPWKGGNKANRYIAGIVEHFRPTGKQCSDGHFIMPPHVWPHILAWRERERENDWWSPPLFFWVTGETKTKCKKRYFNNHETDE